MFRFGFKSGRGRLPRQGLLIYLARPNSDEYLIGEDTYIWGYILPDDSDIRDATGWVTGTANVFYDAAGVPVVALATEIDRAILPFNVVWHLTSETQQTGRLAVYDTAATSATIDKARSVLRDESIDHLFFGDTGIWYDPQDLTTMYQNATGTLPVYRPGSGAVDPPVGLLLDKSQGLELGSELIVNPGPNFTVTTGYAGGVYLSVVDGRLRVTANETVNASSHLQVFPVVPSEGRYLLRIGVRLGSCPNVRGAAWGAGLASFSTLYSDTDWESRQIATAGTATLRVYFHAAAVPGDYFEITHCSIREIKGYHAYQSTTTAHPTLSGRYNLLLGTATLATQSVTTVATNYTLRFEGTGTITLSGTATGTYTAGTHTITCTEGTLTCTVSGTVTRADLRVANDGVGLPPYQAVVNANTYDTAGFPLYLRFDGIDDFLQAANVDLTGTDEVTIAAGSQRFGGANYSRVYELSVDITTNQGAFVCMSPESTLNNNIMFSMRGTTNPAPVILAGNTVSKKIASMFSGKLSADYYSVSVNGEEPVIKSGDFGTGNFSSSPLFVGARGYGPACFFNGRIYSLCILGTLLSLSEQATLERYINSRTRAY